jgi:hypothetical protein
MLANLPSLRVALPRPLLPRRLPLLSAPQAAAALPNLAREPQLVTLVLTRLLLLSCSVLPVLPSLLSCRVSDLDKAQPAFDRCQTLYCHDNTPRYT